ncbi:hypothetical protein QFC22_003471 [Naganishia vaughanmartiniae]|uniref:Uncharacterized protein n=1 Tax=Naganishia vaughanmartiniae TaxID=1424756 RepID=A0ACC2X8K4_9TREE|nr:hypothetical protein QFC22_003471 [Naganishia vaughanmartiniae]
MTESNTQQQQQQLPPPPEAFPLTEYSQIQSQLPSEAVQPSTNPSPSNPFTNNPFGDSNAVSARGSLSASVSVPPPNLFSDIANALQRSIRQVDEQSLRDDAESLAPPPEYQEHQYQETFVPTGIGLEAGLPSYDAAESRDLGAEKDEVETDIEQDARLQGRTLQSTATGTDEKSDLKKAEQHQRTLHHPHIDESLPTHPREMEEKKHIELLAITEAISRAYASSPQLEAQRYKTPPSRQESAFSSSVGAASDLRGSGEASGSLSLSDTASLLAHSGRKAGAGKGKERASGSSLGSEVVMVGGRKMTKEDEAELKKIWDQIERAHGYRTFNLPYSFCVYRVEKADQCTCLLSGLGEQSHVVNPASETERQGRQVSRFTMPSSCLNIRLMLSCLYIILVERRLLP